MKKQTQHSHVSGSDVAATKPRVGVLMGGIGPEREISLKTGDAIATALEARGHRVVRIDVDRRLDETLRKTPIDVAFLALHGTYGEDGCVQGMLETMGIPYTGSGVLASALAMDKAMSKRVFEREALPTPHWMALEAGVPGSAIDTKLLGGYPLVVKPNAQGSTVGLSIVKHPSELQPAIAKASEFDSLVLVEQFIEGRELTVPVIGDEAFPIVEIEPKSGFYDYASKYTKGASAYTCPAKLDKELARHVRELAVESSQVLGCRGVTRVDFRLTEDDEPYILEVNTLPGMTPTSLVPMAAAAKGLTYDQLVGRILDLAVADSRARKTVGQRA